jgi:hypothetical protein
MHNETRGRRVVVPTDRLLSEETIKRIREGAGVTRTAYLNAWKSKPGKVNWPGDT